MGKLKVYVAHSKGFDFREELYVPLREGPLNERYDFVLPHEHSDELFSSKDFFKRTCDILVVEASFPKIGVGIEVGWADAYNVPIIAMHKEGVKLSGSLRPLSKAIVEYADSKEMVSLLEQRLDYLAQTN